MTMQLFSVWLSTFGLIFAIIDPFGYIPIFISMTVRDSDRRRREMLTRACVTAFIVLTFFTLFGSYILAFFRISIPALQISGGLILLAIGLEMVRVIPVSEKLSPPEETEGLEKDDISIIPLAIPMLSGPAAIATVVVLGSGVRRVLDFSAIIVSIAGTLTFTFLILRYAGPNFLPCGAYRSQCGDARDGSTPLCDGHSVSHRWLSCRPIKSC